MTNEDKKYLLFKEVLNKYKKAQTAVINEFSGHIESDLKNLDTEIKSYQSRYKSFKEEVI